MVIKEIVEGRVIELMPNAQFKVNLQDRKDIGCFLSGKMRINKIKVIIGDRVQVELDPYGGKMTNRIIRRL
jgi:translation initiation factor IF-1